MRLAPTDGSSRWSAWYHAHSQRRSPYWRPGFRRRPPVPIRSWCSPAWKSVSCTLGYVDPALKIAFTAGHCRGGGAVTSRDYKVIGHLRAFRDNTPSGSTVATHELIADYEAIVLADDVTASNILPSGRALESRPGVVLHPGQAVCHFGVSTGETCGTVESVNNGWFTMSHGVLSEKGDSGGPVYLAPDGGPAQIVGIFNSVWGGFPAAVSWRSTSEQVHADLGVTPLA